MQVEARLLVLTDEGTPLAGATRIDFVPGVTDAEVNMERSWRRLDELTEDAKVAMQAQRRQLLEDHTDEAEGRPPRRYRGR